MDATVKISDKISREVREHARRDARKLVDSDMHEPALHHSFFFFFLVKFYRTLVEVRDTAVFTWLDCTPWHPVEFRPRASRHRTGDKTGAIERKGDDCWGIVVEERVICFLFPDRSVEK